MHDAIHSTDASHRNPRISHVVDNTAWLKTAAIVLVTVDHVGYFFVDDDGWWRVFGRLAAPTFFFLMGYARTRTIPRHWVGLGVVLTLLESWSANWTWVAPNILLSFALVRGARPYVLVLLQRHGWIAFAVVVATLVAVVPPAAQIAEYGSEGWLWALFGLCQRIHVDGGSPAHTDSPAPNPAPSPTPGPAPSARAVRQNARMRLLACLAAVIVYVWQEQGEYRFPPVQLAVFMLGLGVWSASLCGFRRGPSRIQPPDAVAGALRFIGRHTLEIYALELIGCELLVKLVPDLAR
jgi:hypothetical protein